MCALGIYLKCPPPKAHSHISNITQSITEYYMSHDKVTFDLITYEPVK